MILDRLQISGFLSYNEKIVIDFSEFNLACISGANGAGKSSLLEAITWVLFGEARRRDDAVINLRSNTAEITLDFIYEGAIYQVQRSKTRDKSTLLEFRVKTAEGGWQALTEATMRGTEDLIRRTLHLDYETFINASFFLQGKADQFAQQRPGDRKRILSGILGLDIWEDYREEAARRRRELENDLNLLKAQLDEIESELQQEDARKDALASLEKDLASQQSLAEARKTLLDTQRMNADRIANDQRQVEKQAAEIDRLRFELDQKRDSLQQRLNEQLQYQEQADNEEAIKREVAEWDHARQALANWEKIAANFHEYDSLRNAPLLVIEAEKARLQTELETLQAKQVEIRILEEGLASLEDTLKGHTETISLLKEKLAGRSDLERELRSLLDEKARAGTENRQLKVEMDELVEKITRLEQISGAVCPTCEKPLETDERLRLLEDLKARGKVKGDTHRENVKVIETCDKRIGELESLIADLQRTDDELKLQQRQADARADELNKNQQTITSWQKEGSERLSSVVNSLQNTSFAPEARAELAVIDEQLKQLGYDAAAHEEARTAEEKGRASQNRLIQLEQARSSLILLEREIATLKKSIDTEANHLASLTDEYLAAKETLQRDLANMPNINLLLQEYNDAQQAVNITMQQIGYTRNQVEVLDRLRERKGSLMGEKEQLNQDITNHKTLERAFGKDGIPALLIEQALPEIQEHANEILDRLSAGGMSVTFETQREFKDKKRDDRRETLDILIRDSAGERPYELFSGGEAFRVNFAIRLALSRVLSHRAGARLQTLVIDEGFGSQDSDGRQRLIEAINLVGADFAKILVITHLEELKDAFPARIEVTKAHNGSQVQVVA